MAIIVRKSVKKRKRVDLGGSRTSREKEGWGLENKKIKKQKHTKKKKKPRYYAIEPR